MQSVMLDGFVGRLIEINELDESEVSYISFDGQRKIHSCDDMKSDYEQLFCGNHLYMITAKDSDDHRMQYGGWSYTCDRHFNKLVMEFALKMEEKQLDVDFAVWEDAERKKEEAQLGERKKWNFEPNICPTCGGESEHNWEVHTAELRASNDG